MSEDARSCEAVREELAELALGTLAGRDRSGVIEHLERCELCKAEVAVLARVTDALLELAPAAEPPVGFEQRVSESFASPARRRRVGRSAPRWLAAAAAAVVVAGLGFAGGLLASGGNGTGQAASNAGLTSFALGSHGAKMGEVYLSWSGPAWLVMQVDTGGRSEAVRCAVVLSGGRERTVGWFWLRDGQGLWSASVGAPPSEVRAVELFGAGGSLLASANLAA